MASVDQGTPKVGKMLAGAVLQQPVHQFRDDGVFRDSLVYSQSSHLSHSPSFSCCALKVGKAAQEVLVGVQLSE